MKCPANANTTQEIAMSEKTGRVAEVMAALSACRPLRTVVIWGTSAIVSMSVTLGGVAGAWITTRLSASDAVASEAVAAAGANAHRIDRMGDTLVDLQEQGADTRAAIERLRNDTAQQLALIASLLKDRK